MNIVWEEPPSNRNNRWGPIIDELKSNPGRWAKIQENVSTGIAGYLRRRYPGLELRTVTAGRGYEASRADIYARWVGESDG